MHDACLIQLLHAGCMHASVMHCIRYVSLRDEISQTLTRVLNMICYVIGACFVTSFRVNGYTRSHARHIVFNSHCDDAIWTMNITSSGQYF